MVRGLSPTTNRKEKMITKKHLKELSDIVHMAQSHAQADLEGVAQEILSFAKRHAPNFSQSHWDSYMHKLKKADEQHQIHNPLHSLELQQK